MIAVRSGMEGRNWLEKPVEDADKFSAFVTFKFSYAIVGFPLLSAGLDEYGFLTTGRLVVYNTAYFPFQCRCNGNDQTAVTHGGCYVFVHNALGLGIS